MLYISNIYNFCQLYLNKASKKIKLFKKSKHKIDKKEVNYDT